MTDQGLFINHDQILVPLTLFQHQKSHLQATSLVNHLKHHLNLKDLVTSQVSLLDHQVLQGQVINLVSLLDLATSLDSLQDQVNQH